MRHSTVVMESKCLLIMTQNRQLNFTLWGRKDDKYKLSLNTVCVNIIRRKTTETADGFLTRYSADAKRAPWLWRKENVWAELIDERRMHLIDFEGKIDRFHRLDWINRFKFNF